MPREDNTYLVQPIDGEFGLRYYVESWGQPERPHTVDLSGYGGYGQCDCWNFLKHKSKNIVKAMREKPGELDLNDRTMCQHTKAAHRYWHARALPAYVASHQQQRKNHDE